MVCATIIFMLYVVPLGYSMLYQFFSCRSKEFRFTVSIFIYCPFVSLDFSVSSGCSSSVSTQVASRVGKKLRQSVRHEKIMTENEMLSAATDNKQQASSIIEVSSKI